MSEAYIEYTKSLLKDSKGVIYKNIQFSLSHSVVISYGGIIEALLHEYVFTYFQKKGDEKKIRKFCKTVEYKEVTKVIQKDTKSDIGLVYCERFIKYEKFKTNINLNHLIKGCRDQKILDIKILDKIDNIRKIRNGIHISAILDAKDIFSYKDLLQITEDVRDIFQEIRKEYKKL
ncbi:hypothetical protein N9J72_02915 [Candidatus Gracilibacteria bacterium]|nr:hypothetical protein [Candidatus Gracilibacteria bacterium]